MNLKPLVSTRKKNYEIHYMVSGNADQENTCEIWEIFKNAYFEEHLGTAACWKERNKKNFESYCYTVMLLIFFI